MSHVDNIQLREGMSAIKYLAAYGYDLKQIRRQQADVPPLYFATLPRELTRISDVQERKKLFFSTLLPPILKVNELIREDRKRLKKIVLKLTIGENPTEAEYFWVTRKLVRYDIQVTNVQDFMDRTDDILDELLNRMNIIPPQLALAQAAQESGWGASRFAQKGNALYGQWTWGAGCGMVPKQRDAGKTHRMKCFKTIIEAVESYMHNLNTHKAYRDLRAARRQFRDDQPINVNKLINTLSRYSEEGEEYIIKIKNIIRINKLGDFSNAQLKHVW